MRIGKHSIRHYIKPSLYTSRRKAPKPNVTFPGSPTRNITCEIRKEDIYYRKFRHSKKQYDWSAYCVKWQHIHKLMRSAHDDTRYVTGASLLDGGNQKFDLSLNSTELKTWVCRYALIQMVSTLLAKPKQSVLTTSLCQYSHATMVETCLTATQPWIEIPLKNINQNIYLQASLNSRQWL